MDKISAFDFLQTYIGRDLNSFTDQKMSGNAYFWNVMDRHINVIWKMKVVSLENKVDKTTCFMDNTEYEMLETACLKIEDGVVKDVFFEKECAC